jgi:hypothetical protein
MRSLIFAVLFTWLLAACSGSPSESEARAVFEGRLRTAVNNADVVVNSFEKSNGQEFEAEGVPSYRFFYTARVTLPQGYRTDCVGTNGALLGSRCANPDARGRLLPKAAGATTFFSGVVTFQKTERGWFASDITLSESATPPVINTIRIANPESDRLKTLSPLYQRIGLMRAIRDSGKRCRRVDALGYQEEYRGLAMWVAMCDDGRHWAVFIAPNADVQVRDCSENQQLGLPVCHPVAPLPPDPNAPPSSAVPANSAAMNEAAAANAQ